MNEIPKYLVEVPEGERLTLMDLFARFLSQTEPMYLGKNVLMQLPDFMLDIAEIRAINTSERLPDNRGALYSISTTSINLAFYLERVIETPKVDNTSEFSNEQFRKWHIEIGKRLNSGSEKFIFFEGAWIYKDDIRCIEAYSDGSTRLYFRTGAAAINGTIDCFL